MATEPARPTVTSATPVLLVPDVARTLQWYRQHLGFAGSPFPESPPHVFGILRHGPVEIMLQQLEGYAPTDLYGRRDGGVWHVYIRVSDVRALYEAISGAGDVDIVAPLCPQFYGMTEFVVRDVNGYVLVLAQETEAVT